MPSFKDIRSKTAHFALNDITGWPSTMAQQTFVE
jgi:hypothetical protein